MKHFIKITDRSNNEAVRMGFQLEGLEFKTNDWGEGKTMYAGKLLRGYVVVPFMAWTKDVGPVFLTTDDLQEIAVRVDDTNPYTS